VPDLFVVSPLRRVTQSCLLAFPQYAPGSVRNLPWICHPDCMGNSHDRISTVISHPNNLAQFFPGIDYSLFHEFRFIDNKELNKVKSEVDLLKRTNSFLSWIKGRNERRIVGKLTNIIDDHAGTAPSYHLFLTRFKRMTS